MKTSRFLRGSLRNWRKMSSKEYPSDSYHDKSCSWALRHSMQEEEETIPKDVPKGHLVVYVGENYKRFVIRVSLLKHPLFKALLEQASDEYGFTSDSKLCIPCDEKFFVHVLRCCTNTRIPERWICLCI